jgi:signal transduction histidine kinase
LRAPLRSLEGFSAALREDCAGQLDEKGKHYIARIQANSKRMGQLINDLLDLSRVTTRASFTRQPVDLGALARQIASELQAQSPQRRVAFDIPPSLWVQGDERLLKIVLENLLNNAYKFSARSEQAAIQLYSFEQDGKTVYCVCDNGAGFSMEYAGQLFAPFQRLHDENEFPGTGIGLATVQRIIHRHGGSVWCQSEVGKGASFYFTLG